MELNITHQTHYRFDAPVKYLLQQLRMTPASFDGQAVEAWAIDLTGGQIEAAYTDQHGNQVQLIGIDPGAEECMIRTSGHVRTQDRAGLTGAHTGPSPLWHYLRETELAPTGPRIRDFARSVQRQDTQPIDMLHALSAAVLSAMPYEIGVTDAQTTGEEAARLGAGVCQDHAHAFMAAARLLNIPARYVSGYLFIGDRPVQEAGHAWAEAYVPDVGWIGFDVSNGISPDDRYVRVAVGLDANEAAPVRGLAFGNHTEYLAVHIQVQQ